LIEPNCHAVIDDYGNVTINIESTLAIKDCNSYKKINEVPFDSIELSIFGHRFMSIAEQMGITLQKTAASTNIKERLDFSCALFD
jgi:5-oxoprolinase (ATP-hydrolysing)